LKIKFESFLAHFHLHFRGRGVAYLPASFYIFFSRTKNSIQILGHDFFHFGEFSHYEKIIIQSELSKGVFLKEYTKVTIFGERKKG